MRRVGIAVIAVVMTMALHAGLASAKKKPDLVVSSVDNPPASVAPGASMTLGDTTKNAGKKTAGASQTAFYLSSDATVGAGDTKLSPSRSVKKLKKKKKSSGTVAVAVPAGAKPATLRLIACADDGGVVKEKKEANNCTVAAGTVKVLDKTPPAKPTISVSPASPTNENNPHVTGTTEAGASVRVFNSSSCGGAAIGSGSANGSGHFDVVATVPINATSHIAAKAIDASDNASACSNVVNYTEDSAAPAKPTNLQSTPASPSTDTNPTLTATVAEGTAKIYTTPDCTGDPVETASPAQLASGVPVGVPAAGTTEFSVDATDAAGNTSQCSNSLAYTVLPLAPEGLEFAPVSPGHTTTPTLSGVASSGGGGTVSVFKSADCSGAPVAQGTDSEFATGFVVSADSEAVSLFSASVTDGFGNTSACSTDEPYAQTAGEIESEPNNDNGAADTLTPGTPVTGAIKPGDHDWFAVTLPSEKALTVSTTDFTDTCTVSRGDTFVKVYGTDGTTLLASDDDSGPGSCSNATGGALADLQAGTYYVEVSGFNSASRVDAYRVNAQLDDVVPNVPSTPEIEPNNNAADADASGQTISGDTRIGGAIAVVNDQDVFKVSVASPNTVIRFETYDGTGNDCQPVSLTTTLTLFAADGSTQLKTDSGSGISGCAELTVPVTTGTYYIRVNESGNNGTVAGYQLEADFLTSSGAESEANDTAGTANAISSGSFVFGNHTTEDDVDWFAVNVPAGKSVQAELVEGDTLETCESNGIDSEIYLVAPDGSTVLDSDDDSGRGFCSNMDGTGASPHDPGAHNLAAGTYYVRVERSDLASADQSRLFTYRLAVRVK